MLSSIGVQRRTQMPFPVLNACGVLDAKAAGEAAIQADAEVRAPNSTPNPTPNPSPSPYP